MTTERSVELYKNHRPGTWGDFVGQEKTVKSIQTMLRAKAVPTVLVFSGTRGSGKTSAALVLAKALNCENPVTKTQDPCLTCPTCLAIDAGTQLGVTYISAANQQGVDSVRELMRTARLSQPVKRQVFILDEVHNYSKPAWDSLLIPLEDTSMKPLFILCTTEIAKVPDTVLSRGQQRRFSPIPSEPMITHLRKVLAEEKEHNPELPDYDDEMIFAAVRMGRGSVRDTLSSMDSIFYTGMEEKSHGGKILEAMATGDITEIYKATAAAGLEDVNFRDLTEDLFADLTSLLLLTKGVDPSLAGNPPVTDWRKVSVGLGKGNGIHLYLREVADALTSMSMGADYRILCEIALLKGSDGVRRLRARQQQQQQK